METLRGVGALVGRVLLALIFIMSGSAKFTHPAMFAEMMGQAGVSAGLVMLLLYASAAIELLGGVLLAVGYQGRWVAAVMVLWLIPVTIVMHAIPGGMLNQVMVMKNLAIMGGLLMVAVQGSGGMSLDAIRARGA
jgi:putative oxidoreductase